MLSSHSCRFPTLDSVQKEKIVGWWREAIPDRNKTSPTSWTWAEVKKHKKHQAGLHTVTKKHTEVLKEPARSTKSNMCCSNYRYIQPSNKNNRSHNISEQNIMGEKNGQSKKSISFPAIYKYIWPIQLSIKILFTFSHWRTVVKSWGTTIPNVNVVGRCFSSLFLSFVI